MVIGLTELKRLGLVRKPAVVVPNSMLEQFAREWLQLYPQATILAAGVDELAADQRRRFVARVATNDWDAVILTRTAFERLALSPHHEAAFVDTELDLQRQALTRVKADGAIGPSVKALERALARAEERLRASLDKPVDPGVTFEASGIDYLVVDELHDYKNLATPSRITGAGLAGSKRSLDLFAKIEYLRATNGARVFTGATATPIANSITEMFVMMRYHDPDALRELGTIDFDSWAATFGTVVTVPEVRVQGDGFKMKSRLARFNNVPELLALFNRFADIKGAADLDLPRPQIAARPEDGTRAAHLLVVPRTTAQAEFMARIAERAELIEGRQVDPAEDNMLKLSSHARLGSLDLRLVDLAGYTNADAGNKVDAAADLLARVYHDTKHASYTDRATGDPSPHLGALQLVFCDLGTPGKPGQAVTAGWDVYHALREALAGRGVPADRVRFIHEARKDRDKAMLFSACRNGHVSVLVGSTAKMGTGVNIQDRVVHLLHLNAPWRPADLTQRNGRGLRHGNQNSELMLTQVVTEQTFDTYSWQTLERKAVFIGQIMNGRSETRQSGDIGEDAFSYAEAKAIGSGNPRLIELAQAHADVGRLTRLETAHQRTERGLAATITNGTHELDRLTAEQHALHTTLGHATGSDEFVMDIHHPALGRGPDRTPARWLACTERARAVVELNRVIPRTHHDPRTVAHIGGHDIVAELLPTRIFGDHEVSYRLAEAPTITTTVPWTQGDRTPAVDLGTISRLEHLPARIPTRLDAIALRTAEVERNVRTAQDLQGTPFKHADSLVAARERYQALSTEIADNRNQPSWETTTRTRANPSRPPATIDGRMPATPSI